MLIKELVRDWFVKWENGDFFNLPITESFSHTSPFGTVEGKKEYFSLVKNNKDKFLGYRFNINDEIYDSQKACVCYTAIQGEFKLEVSEWYYLKDNLIDQIIAYYHIGEIKEERMLKGT